jgi:hypothetical protein
MHASGGFRRLRVPLAEPILHHLESVHALQVNVVTHLESGLPFFLRIEGFKHKLTFILNLAMLSTYFASKSLYSLFDHNLQGLTAIRQIWFESRTQFWTRWFFLTNPRLVLGIGLTESEILAARSADIPTVEIQHGIFDSTAADYYWPTSKPDYFGVWPFAEEKDIGGSGISKLNIPFPLGSDGVKAGDHDGQRDHILCALSWGEIDGDPKFMGALPKRLQILLDQIKSHSHTFVFRTHPAFRSRDVRALRKALQSAYPDSKFLDGRRESLETSLRSSQIVILDKSSTWVSAVMLGFPILTTSRETFARLENLLSNPGEAGCFLVENLGDYSVALESIAEKRGPSTALTPALESHDWTCFDELLTAKGPR